MDVSLYARFDRSGHALTGDRRRSSAEVKARVGYDYAHAIVDDHSRIAYAELLDDDRAPTVTVFVERALDAFARQGIAARRLMTDNAWSYTKNRSLRELLGRRGIRHLTIHPRRPRTNDRSAAFTTSVGRTPSQRPRASVHDGAREARSSFGVRQTNLERDCASRPLPQLWELQVRVR